MFNQIYQSKSLKIFLALILIFMITATDFLASGYFVIESIALDNENITENDQKVKFDVYFNIQDEKAKEVNATINDETIDLYFNVSVNDVAYFANGKIEIEDSNFIFNDTANYIEVPQVSEGNNITLSTKIRAVKTKEYNLEMLSKASTIKLTGNYIDNEGENEKLETTKQVKINWQVPEGLEIDIKQNVITNKKYIIDGVQKNILQVEVTSELINGKYPIVKSSLEAIAPSYENAILESVNVVALTTEETNGKTVNEINGDYWNFDKETNTVFINADNAIKDNIVCWEGAEKEKSDKYLITYVYSGDTSITAVTSNVTAKTVLVNNMELTKQDVFESEIEKELGIATNIGFDNAKQEIYKGKLYIDKELEYEFNYSVNITYSQLNSRIIIENINNRIVNSNNEIFEEIKTYYNSTTIKVEDVKRVLGENGVIKVYDFRDYYSEDGEKNCIVEIDLNNINDEQEYIYFEYERKPEEVVFEMSSPVTDGRIEIKNNKYIKERELNEEIIQSIDKVYSDIKVSEKEKEAIVSKVYTEEIKLLNPEVNFAAYLDKDIISTNSINDINMFIVLESDSADDKLYENPVIEIEVPEEATELKVRNIQLAYDEELKINDISVIKNENNKDAIRIELRGKQTDYNTSNLQKGANIILDMQATFRKDITDRTVSFKTKCINNSSVKEASNNIKLVANHGLINQNKVYINEELKVETTNENLTEVSLVPEISNYNIKVEERFINNYSETIENLEIIGSIENAEKDSLKLDFNNEFNLLNKDYSIVYSIDGEEWKNEFLAGTKYFKVIVNNNLEQAEEVVLKYSFVTSQIVPSTVSNTNLKLSFKVNGNTTNKTIDINFAMQARVVSAQLFSSISDKVEIKIEPQTELEKLYENQIVTYKISVTNKTEEELNDLKLEFVAPEEGIITELIAAQAGEMEYKNYETKNYIWEINIGKQAIVEKEIDLRINEFEAEEKQIVVVANLKSAGGETLKTESLERIARQQEVEVRISTIDNYSIAMTEGSVMKYTFALRNTTNKKLENLIATIKVPEHTKYYESKSNVQWIYNQEKDCYEYHIGDLEAGKGFAIPDFYVKVDEFNEPSYEITNSIVLTGNNIEKHQSNIYMTKLNKGILDIHLTSEHSKQLNEGDIVRYVIKVTNTGTRSKTAKITDIIPENIQSRKVEYYINGELKAKNNLTSNSVKIDYPLEINEELTIIIEGIVYDLPNDVKEVEISNYAELNLGNNKVLKSEEVVNIIINDYVKKESSKPSSSSSKSSEKSNSSSKQEENSSSSSKSEKKSSSAKKSSSSDKEQENKYSISGKAWIDLNEDGINEEEDLILSGVKVYLLNENGDRVKNEEEKDITTTTSVIGTYKFTNLEEGNYIVLFEYDTTKYKLTTYNEQKASKEGNSDAFNKHMQINGEEKLVAVTNVLEVKGDSLNNIDIGLVSKDKFDLSLTKTLNNVVVTNASGETTYTYQNTDLTKIDIKGKYLAGSQIKITYDIKIKNEGNVTAYAESIVDYLSSGLEFKSESNSGWYLDGNKNLHNTTLSRSTY